MIPTGLATGQWVKVAGPGNVNVFVSPNTPGLTFRYTTSDGVQRTWKTGAAKGGGYPGPDGREIARWVRVAGKLTLVFSTAALLDTDTDLRRRACPALVKGATTELGQDYEDYRKAKTNPGNPTPHGFSYACVDPLSGKIVKIDDCVQQTGDPREYKGRGFAKHFFKADFIWIMKMYPDMIKQAAAQIRAGGHLVWYFHEKAVADYMREQFEKRLVNPGRMGSMPEVRR